MKIIHAYILRGLFVNFFVGLGVFVAVLTMGFMIKSADLFAQGFSLKDIGALFLLLIPYSLSYCIPIAFLSAILLIFGRLSQDNELLAMKASGISIYQICYPIWFLGAFLTLICFKINNDTIPYSHYAARKKMVQMGLKNPTAYLEPGSFVEIFPNHIIYIRERHEDLLKNIVIYQTVTNPQVETSEPSSSNESAKEQVKTITAKEGRILYDPNASVISLELKEGAIQEPTGEYFKEFYNVQFGSYTVKLDVSKLFQTPKELHKKHKDMTISEIREKIQQFQGKGINITPFITEIQRKIAISFSCLVFALIGIPLGIRAHRSEKTVGVGLGLLLFFLYYLFIIFGKALDEKPQFHPELLMWLPNVLLVAIGIYLLARNK